MYVDLGYQGNNTFFEQSSTYYSANLKCILETASKEVAIIWKEVMESFSESNIDKEKFKRTK